MRTLSSTARTKLSIAGWWALTVATLVVLDDLTFGPAFWLISRLAGPTAAIAAIAATYIPGQLYLVWRGTSDQPGRIAGAFLKRLDLQRRNQKVEQNEQALRRQIVGGVSAVLISLLVAGVLPPLVLYRNGASRSFVMRIAVPCAVVYTAEFALLHGFLPAVIV